MSIIFVVIIILIISTILALKDVKSELSVPSAVANLKIKKKKGLSGVIIFLKKKVIHYSSDSS